jgi:hypothetical protein
MLILKGNMLNNSEGARKYGEINEKVISSCRYPYRFAVKQQHHLVWTADGQTTAYCMAYSAGLLV